MNHENSYAILVIVRDEMHYNAQLFENLLLKCLSLCSSYYWKILVCQWVLPFTATSQQEVQSADIIKEKGSPQKETSAWKRLETFTVFLKVSSPT